MTCDVKCRRSGIRIKPQLIMRLKQDGFEKCNHTKRSYPYSDRNVLEMPSNTSAGKCVSNGAFDI